MRDPSELARPDLVLLWDLDGTIADTRHDIATGVSEMLRELGRPQLSADDVIRNVGRGVRVLVSLCLADAGGPAGDEEEIDRAIAIFRRHYWRHLMDTTRAYDRLPEILHTLKARGRSMAVVSNKPEDATREILTRLGLVECFAAVLGGDTLPERKPAAEPMFRALRACNPDGRVENAAVIGDSMVDFQAARASRMPIAGVGWGFDPDGTLRVSEVDWWFESTEELGRALLGDR